ncbi:DUF6059 family protein [Streptomyces lydicus]|uniref:DUF6059 family protein n=1 Tax=Streptomyces lydicus TaxID=47763 RepID=UPI0037A937AA
MHNLVRVLLLTVYGGLKALGALYCPLPPPDLGGEVLAEEPPAGSPERLVPGGSATEAERWLFDELRREMRWPTS